MDMYFALAESTRRRIIEIVASQGEMSASTISKRFSVSPSAISQHLKILRESRLLLMEKRAQQRIYRVNPDTMHEFEKWVQQLQQMLDDRFSALDRVLASEKARMERKTGKGKNVQG